MLLFYNSNEDDFSHIHLYMTYSDPHSSHFLLFYLTLFYLTLTLWMYSCIQVCRWKFVHVGLWMCGQKLLSEVLFVLDAPWTFAEGHYWTSAGEPFQISA